MKALKALTAVAVFALFFVLSTDRPNAPTTGAYISPVFLVADTITETSASFWFYSDSTGVELPEGSSFKLVSPAAYKRTRVQVTLFVHDPPVVLAPSQPVSPGTTPKAPTP